MNLVLPEKLNTSTPPVIEDARVLVVIGANGAGKSSFGKDIISRYPEHAIGISGMRSLFISSESLSLKTISADRSSLPMLSEYQMLTLRLQQEEFEAAVNYKETSKHTPGLEPPTTKIDVIQRIWEKMFPHNRLIRKSGFFELVSASRDGNSYNAERMSDGEKIVFYLIGAVLCAEPNAILIIEEPEVLLHDSIKNALWNEIEVCRPDCTYIYLTHDIGFATARSEGKRIWVRSYDADEQQWDYELIESNESYPEEVYLEILGSRKPILFIEGNDSNSIDSRLYPYIFPDYLVKPMGGCQKVIETTKAFGQLKNFHTLDSKGIVDRDRRTQGEISYLREQNILVPDVAEVENLLLIEMVIKTVASRLMKNPEEVFVQVKENIIRLFEKDLYAQVILHAKHRVRKKLETTTDRKINTVEELAGHIEMIEQNIHVYEIYEEIKTEFETYISSANYPQILRVYNQKGMLPQSRLCSIIGINNKESYLNLILSILKENKEDAVAIRLAIKESLGA